ncbi:hypothetical protein AAC387_Pa05g2116 [Persea americana]
MSRTEDPNANWTTWEELLLAFAINRHGTKSWDSIAIEIQNRTSSSLLLTANNCKQKYHELQRRFKAVDDKTNGVDDESNNCDDKIPWLDELRKLRVAELRREVQRYDVSIVSLQSKVKKLKEDREQSSKETDNDDGKPDLKKEGAENERDDEKRDYEGEKRSKPASGNDSDRENQSFNESNSTDSKYRNPEIEIGTDENNRKKEERFPKPEQEAEAEAGSRKLTDPDVPGGESPADEAAGEGSYNGSSDTIAKGAVVSSAVKSPAKASVPEVGESAEFHESVAESKGGEEGMKENSDVQSSASLSRKKRRTKDATGNSSGDEPEPDEVSPASKRISVKSHPLVGFLEIIRSHKHGSVFERRLESQESARYHSIIRQHLDLEMVRTKLEEGLYSDRSPEFFRDLLLLFNNAIVFFPRNSPESVAASNLRDIVSKEVRRSFPKSSPPSKEPAPPSLSLPKSAPETSNSLPAKPNSSAPTIALGKRSSASAKAQPIVQTVLVDEKHEAVEPKEPERSSPANLGAVEGRVTKKRTRERSSSVARGTRTNNTTRSNNNHNSMSTTRVTNPISNPSSNSNSTVKAAAPNENSEAKLEKKSAANSAVVAKKRSAASFLNRMKRSLSSSTTTEGTLLDSLKSSINNSTTSGGGGSGQKKKGGGSGKGDGRRDSSLRQSSVKQMEEQKSQAGKRSVGRPPKRAPVQTSSSRRAKETEAKHPPPRKRARR